MMLTRPASLFLLLTAFVLGGCGFQLRGHVAMPEGLERIQVQAPGKLKDDLALYLDASGVTVTPTDADAVLMVSNERFERRVLTVDPRTGKSREYELAYSLMFELRRRDGSRILAPQQVRLLRDYVFDEDALIGKNLEESVLRDEMRRDAVQQILLRIQAAS